MAKSSKSSTSSSLTVRSSQTGKFVTVKGVGALKGSGFAVRKSIDLTKPIAKQATKNKPTAKSLVIG